MKISNVNMNFGRKLVASCNIGDNSGNVRRAYVYQFDPLDKNDVIDIVDSFDKYDIRKSDNPEFYILKDDKTDETILASQITKHKAIHHSMNDFVEIDSMSQKEAYSAYSDSALTMMIGVISNLAKSFNADHILVDSERMPAENPSKYGFRPILFNNFIMSSKQFDQNIEQAERESSINYCA